MGRTIPTTGVRNIGILASQDAGRTTTTERLLAVARQGVGAVAAVEDAPDSWLSSDNVRAITLTSAATSCEWGDCRINIVEFSGAQRPANDILLSVVDGLVIVIDAATGVTAKTEAALALARRYGLPRVVFVNKLDLADADLSGVMTALDASCPAKPILLQLPLGASLRGLANLVDLRASIWSGSGLDATAEDLPIPEGDLVAAQQARAGVLRALGLDEQNASADGLRAALRRAVLAGDVSPVLCGSAFRNRGIASLLDAVVGYLPGASDIGDLNARGAGGPMMVVPTSEQPFVGVAFREVAEPGHDGLTFVRVYAGIVAAGTEIWNSAAACPERVERILRVRANEIEEIAEAQAGDIVALVGLKRTSTGDTLCDPHVPVVLERVPTAPIPASAGHAKH